MNNPHGSLLASLAHLQNQYPTGIAKRFLKVQRASERETLFLGASASELAFIVAESGVDTELKSAEGQLLVAAITKGLKRELKQTLIVLTSSSHPPEISLIGGRACLALGADALRSLKLSPTEKLGVAIPFGAGQTVIATHMLSDVLHSAERKREFWEHLKLANQFAV